MKTIRNKTDGKLTTRRAGNSSGAGVVVFVIGAVVLFAIFGKDEELQRTIKSAVSEANPVVVTLEGEHDAGIIQDELDYGYTVKVTVKNTGKKGFVGVTPWVTCSEGEWSRTQNLHFAAGEVNTLTFFFPEPTLNASNVRYGVRLSP